ncbi:DciA family protein, partial [Streptomyces sp. NPDC008150]|uniref:DciA family protein n=1 Tax=Streptomyces sp. NPDC008150 TaxID=3364816 RepID=UPI0036E0D58D
MSQEPTGVDLARVALAAARAKAKTHPEPAPRKRRPRSTDRQPGDPMGLGLAITRMMSERGWEPPEPGGSILDTWPQIAPQLADKVAAVRFEHDTGTLHLLPVSPAYAAQLRLHQAGILTRVQASPAGRPVRALKILPPGVPPKPAHHEDRPEPAPAAPAA